MATPYMLVSNDHWRQPREVCVVDEINCMMGEDAEVIVNGGKNSISVAKARRWLGMLPIEFSETEKCDRLGVFTEFICRPLRAAVDPIAHALNELSEF